MCMLLSWQHNKPDIEIVIVFTIGHRQPNTNDVHVIGAINSVGVEVFDVYVVPSAMYSPPLANST